jgi:hypothetical protein
MTFGYFLVLPCIVLYPLTDFKESSVSESTVHAGIYQYIPVYTSMYQYIPNSKSMYRFIPKHNFLYQHMSVHTSIYQHILAYICTYWYVLVCASMCWYVLACTNLDLDSKMVQTRFEPAIFCILVVCFTAALREYRHQTPDM